MANPTSNFGWQMPTNTDLVKDLPADFEVFGQAVDTSLMDLKGGTTGQVLSKASNTDMDFTWVAQDDSNAIQNALLTTTGDTIYASAASTPARLGIGTNGQVLTVSGGVPTWQTSTSGSLTSLATGSLSGSSVTISSISSSYQSLRLDLRGLSTSVQCSVQVRFNSDTSFIYGMVIWARSDLVYQTNGDDKIRLNSLAELPAAGTRNAWCIDIPNYKDTSSNKIISFNGAIRDTNYDPSAIIGTAYYASTSAISSITILASSGTFDGGTYQVFGVN